MMWRREICVCFRFLPIPSIHVRHRRFRPLSDSSRLLHELHDCLLHLDHPLPFPLLFLSTLEVRSHLPLQPPMYGAVQRCLLLFVVLSSLRVDRLAPDGCVWMDSPIEVITTDVVPRTHVDLPVYDRPDKLFSHGSIIGSRSGPRL